jgi:hypothetical protein
MFDFTAHGTLAGDKAASRRVQVQLPLVYMIARPPLEKDADDARRQLTR